MTISQKHLDTSVNSRLIIFINKIDLPNSSVENPVCYKFISNGDNSFMLFMILVIYINYCNLNSQDPVKYNKDTDCCSFV